MKHLAQLIPLVLILASNGVHADQPLKKLTEDQLDSISAGSLTISTDAIAEAGGANTSANTDTNVLIKQSKKRKHGYSYTVGKGYAYATANGEFAYTDALANYVTEEHVVSLKIIYQDKSSLQKRNNKNRNATTKKRSRIKIRIVTRR